MKRPATRRIAAKGDGAAVTLDRHDSDPAGELIPAVVMADEGPRELFTQLVSAKRRLDELTPEVQSANAAYDAAVKSVEDYLVDHELKSAGAEDVLGCSVRVTLAEGTNLTVLDKEKVREWCEAHMPDLLTVNSRTLQAWFKNEAPEEVRADPTSIGVEMRPYSRPQVVIRPNKG